MTGVVRPRRELVHDESPVGQHEHLDAQDPDDVESFEDRASDLVRLFARGGRDRGLSRRQIEDLIHVRVLERFVDRDLSTRSARRDHRDLSDGRPNKRAVATVTI